MDKNSLRYQLYKLDNENEINALVKDETIWLTQKSMGELFGVGVPAIAKHLSSIFDSGELEQNSTVSKMETVQQEDNRTVKGNISKTDAERKARLEYDAYNKTQKINSDFERKIAKSKEVQKNG